MNKTKFFVVQEIIIDKIEDLSKKTYLKKLIKENKSHKSIVCIVCKGTM